MIGNRITARRALPSPGTVHTTLERDHPFSRTVQTRERHSRPRALPLPSRAGAIGSNGSLPASWGTAPPAADRLRSPPAGSVADDLIASGNKLCVDSGLASFGAFCGVFRLQGRLCRSQATWHGRSPRPFPRGTRFQLLSFVESSMTRLESCPTIRPWLTSHLSSAIRRLSSAISPSPFPVPHSAFVRLALEPVICRCVELAMTHRSASRCVFATHPTCSFLIPALSSICD